MFSPISDLLSEIKADNTQHWLQLSNGPQIIRHQCPFSTALSEEMNWSL